MFVTELGTANLSYWFCMVGNRTGKLLILVLYRLATEPGTLFIGLIQVGDRTGYCKLLVWDEAVVFFSRILEGDIIVLGRDLDFNHFLNLDSFV